MATYIIIYEPMTARRQALIDKTTNWPNFTLVPKGAGTTPHPGWNYTQDTSRVGTADADLLKDVTSDDEVYLLTYADTAASDLASDLKGYGLGLATVHLVLYDYNYNEGQASGTADTADPTLTRQLYQALGNVQIDVTVVGYSQSFADYPTNTTATFSEPAPAPPPAPLEWAGSYETAIKYGGASGTWRQHSVLEVSPQRVVTYGGTEIINPSWAGDDLSWDWAHNNSHAQVKFAKSSRSPYFWGNDQETGQCFTGSFNNDKKSGAVDFRGLLKQP